MTVFSGKVGMKRNKNHPFRKYKKRILTLRINMILFIMNQ